MSKALEEEIRGLRRTLQLLVSKAERNREVLASFQAMELKLLACGSLADLLDTLLRDLKSSFRLDRVGLVLFDPEHAARDLIPDYRAPEPSALRFVVRNAELRRLYGEAPAPILVPADSDLARHAFPQPNSLGSCALLPLIRQNVLIGSLHLGSRDPARYGSEVATDYISHLASIISVCVENCISQDTLRRLSSMDMLTRVHNRRSFDQELIREVDRSLRLQRPLSCLFVDLDHFKQINDRFGHQTGDRVLRQAAETIRERLRKTDLIARYGGEEFALLLPDCGQPQALEVAEAIRIHVEGRRFESEEGSEVSVTLSIGVATLQPERWRSGVTQQRARALVAAADKGVYQAKRGGRNRVCAAVLTDQPAPDL